VSHESWKDYLDAIREREKSIATRETEIIEKIAARVVELMDERKEGRRVEVAKAEYERGYSDAIDEHRHVMPKIRNWVDLALVRCPACRLELSYEGQNHVCRP
jgi:hypothetical protein